MHRGFHQVARTVWSALEEELVRQGKPQVLFVGHSLGAALATLTSFWWSYRAPQGTFSLVFTAGSPRVGNNAFASLCAQRVPHRWQVINQADVVPDLPPPVTPQADLEWEQWGGFFPVPRVSSKDWFYTHVGGGEILFRSNLDSLKKNHVRAYRDFFHAHLSPQ